MSEPYESTADSKTNELRTRSSLIDPALKRAGWNVNDRTQVGLEIPVDGYDKSRGMASATTAFTMPPEACWQS